MEHPIYYDRIIEVRYHSYILYSFIFNGKARIINGTSFINKIVIMRIALIFNSVSVSPTPGMMVKLTTSLMTKVMTRMTTTTAVVLIMVMMFVTIVRISIIKLMMFRTTTAKDGKNCNYKIMADNK